jgi:hypothetical protein
MTPKNPFDMREMFKAFDPAEMTKMFQPEALMAMFKMPANAGSDMEMLIAANKQNFDAMTAANKAAAESYKDMLSRQVEIFETLTAPAREKLSGLGVGADQGQMKAAVDAMNEAVQKSLKFMEELGDAARTANESAMAKIKSEIDKMTA